MAVAEYLMSLILLRFDYWVW